MAVLRGTHTLKFVHQETGGEAAHVGGQGADKEEMMVWTNVAHPCIGYDNMLLLNVGRRISGQRGENLLNICSEMMITVFQKGILMCTLARCNKVHV